MSFWCLQIDQKTNQVFVRLSALASKKSWFLVDLKRPKEHFEINWPLCYFFNYQVEETLKFLQFLLQDGYLKLHAPQAKKIWNCLIENPVFIQGWAHDMFSRFFPPNIWFDFSQNWGKKLLFRPIRNLFYFSTEKFWWKYL